MESTRSCIPEKCLRCSRGSFCRNTLPNSRLSVEVEPERRFHRPLHLTLRRFGSEFSDDPLILHRLTPKLATKNGQVGPPFGPQDIPIGGGCQFTLTCSHGPIFVCFVCVTTSSVALKYPHLQSKVQQVFSRIPASPVKDSPKRLIEPTRRAYDSEPALSELRR